jgi:hypothetical protein
MTPSQSKRKVSNLSRRAEYSSAVVSFWDVRDMVTS